MRIAVERRGDEWLAQVVHIGDGLHWTAHQRIQNQMRKWIEQNCHDYSISGWQFYFKTEQDLTLFLLRWNDTDQT